MMKMMRERERERGKGRERQIETETERNRDTQREGDQLCAVRNANLLAETAHALQQPDVAVVEEVEAADGVDPVH